MKTTSISIALAAAVCAAGLAGCATPDFRIKENPEVFAQLPPEQQALVRAGRVGVGLSMDAVKLALGNPSRVTLRTNANGETQIWHYVEYAYYDAGFLYPGWGWGGGFGPRWGGWDGGWAWDGAWGGPGIGDDYAVPYDHFRIEFQNGKVSSIDEEMPN